MAQKRLVYIPEGSTIMLEKFINYIMKQGKKTIARKIFNDAMDIIADKTKQDPKKLFEEAIENVKPQIEVRPKRIGGAVYQIPVEVKPGRAMMLSYRWILGAANSRKNAPMADKLAEELINAAKKEGSAIKKREDMHKMAQANKAFAHFAKY